jgi:hypothetical protein
MANISFTPTFHPTDYVDNQDRVQAGGPNGFNARFRALETDLRKLSTVITDVDTALDQLGAPTPTQHTLTLSPALVPVVNRGPWSYDSSGYASRTGPLTALTGVQPVSVPDGARLVSLRSLGQNSGTGTLHIDLLRSGLLTSVTPADSGLALVDTARFRYLILADLAGAAAADTVTISGFQIIYTA